MANRLPDPKKHYVKLEMYGTLLVPIEMVPAFKDVIVTEHRYEDGRGTFKFNGRNLTFETVNNDDLMADMAAHKLEE